MLIFAAVLIFCLGIGEPLMNIFECAFPDAIDKMMNILKIGPEEFEY